MKKILKKPPLTKTSVYNTGEEKFLSPQRLFSREERHE
jgi:hypothetical protein